MKKEVGKYRELVCRQQEWLLTSSNSTNSSSFLFYLAISALRLEHSRDKIMCKLAVLPNASLQPHVKAINTCHPHSSLQLKTYACLHTVYWPDTPYYNRQHLNKSTGRSSVLFMYVKPIWYLAIMQSIKVKLYIKYMYYILYIYNT